MDWKSKIPTYFSGGEIYNNRRVQSLTVPVPVDNVLILDKRNKPDLRHLNKFLVVELEKLPLAIVLPHPRRFFVLILPPLVRIP